MMIDLDAAIPKQHQPRCARCDMPVEGFYADFDSERIEFYAICHGSQEIISMTLSEFNSLTEITFGLAFADPQPDPQGLHIWRTDT